MLLQRIIMMMETEEKQKIIYLYTSFIIQVHLLDFDFDFEELRFVVVEVLH